MGVFPGNNRKILNGDQCRPITASSAGLIDPNLFTAQVQGATGTANPFDPGTTGSFATWELMMEADDCTSNFCRTGHTLTVISPDTTQAPVVIDGVTGVVTLVDDFNLEFTTNPAITPATGEWEYIYEVCLVMYDGKEFTYTHSVKATF